MNNHLIKQIKSNNFSILPEEMQKEILFDFDIMNSLGIDNDKDQNIYFIVSNHVPELVFGIFKKSFPNDKIMKYIAAEVFKNRNDKPINTLLELIEATNCALKKMIPGFSKIKLAYPQPSVFKTPLPQYDLNRWVKATRDIYNLMSLHNLDKITAIDEITKDWDKREIMSYKTWLKYYEENGPNNYKTASVDEPLFLGNFPLTGKIPNVRPSGEGYASKGIPGMPPTLPQTDVSNVRDTIEGQRRKLISRLNAAEKLLASTDGQVFAGNDQEFMLKLLQDLKRRIQTANKRTAKSTLFEDHIYKTSNLLLREGNKKAASFFYKLAQLPDFSSESTLPDLSAPSMSGGDEMTPPPGSASSSSGDKEGTKALLQEFFDGLKRGVSDKDDTPEEREAQKQASIDDILNIGNGYWMKKTSQEASSQPKRKPEFVQAPEIATAESSSEENTDDIIDSALQNITINDVIKRLEMLVSIYNQREISRQLAVLDIMMDRLGLASFFPSLGEAMSKALEANQYIGNRLEEILTKIKGSVSIQGTSDWVESKDTPNPSTQNIRNNLESQKQQEDERRELRKQKELSKLKGGEGQQQAGQSEDLQQPARIERSPKIEVR